MMTLRTWLVDSSLDKVKIAWSTGLNKCGTVIVAFPEPQASHELIAEFVAIRHLLFHEQVFDRYPVAGDGHSFFFSSEQILQIITGARKTRNLVPYARFLWSDMLGAAMKVNGNDDRLQSALEGPSLTIEFDHYLHAGKITYTTPVLGKIQISPHAVQRYTERNTDFIKSPRRSLMRFLYRPEFVQTQLPDSVLKHKSMRYGPHDPAETWTLPGSNLYLLFIVKDGYKELVTCYVPDLAPFKKRNAALRRKEQESIWREKQAKAVLPKTKKKIRVVL
ncbi:hypothetical protein KO116_P200097 (plasmid) [Halomonas sp. KO116]|nr:hypothetical protein KO116_P200097 [Halomonas sp. KO116]